jgi:hypothetical protein
VAIAMEMLTTKAFISASVVSRTSCPFIAWLQIPNGHIARISTCETIELSSGANMNGNRNYGVRVEGAKYGVGFGSALAIAISYTANHSIVWAIIHGILGWLYVIYFALFRS